MGHRSPVDIYLRNIYKKTSYEIEAFVETHLCKLCVIRTRVLRVPFGLVYLIHGSPIGRRWVAHKSPSMGHSWISHGFVVLAHGLIMGHSYGFIRLAQLSHESSLGVHSAGPWVSHGSPYFFFSTSLLLSSLTRGRFLPSTSFWTSRGHRCPPFSPPVLAFIFCLA